MFDQGLFNTADPLPESIDWESVFTKIFIIEAAEKKTRKSSHDEIILGLKDGLHTVGRGLYDSVYYYLSGFRQHGLNHRSGKKLLDFLEVDAEKLATYVLSLNSLFKDVDREEIISCWQRIVNKRSGPPEEWDEIYTELVANTPAQRPDLFPAPKPIQRQPAAVNAGPSFYDLLDSVAISGGGSFENQFDTAMSLYFMRNRISMDANLTVLVDKNPTDYYERMDKTLLQASYVKYVCGGCVFYVKENATGPEVALTVEPNRQVYGSDDIRIIIRGATEQAKKTKELLDSIKVSVPVYCSLMQFIRARADYQFTPHDVSDKELGRTEFYPFLTETIEEYIDGFFNSTAPILLLIGPPGTGKSSWIRKMIHHHPKRKGLLAFGDVLEQDDFFMRFLSSDYDTLYVEDADLLVGKREDGNSKMQAILNGTDGVLDFNKKLVISTNLPSTSRVDGALLRDGRCYAVLPFKPLKREEANVVLEVLGRDPLPEGGDTTYTLARVLKRTNRVDESIDSDAMFGFKPKGVNDE